MESAKVYELRGSCTEALKTRGDSFIWTYNSATSTTAGPLAQSAQTNRLFFSFFKVLVGIYSNQNHLVHTPHQRDTGNEMKQTNKQTTAKLRENSIIKTKNSAALNIAGPLAQSAERGADNAKVVSSILTWTI